MKRLVIGFLCAFLALSGGIQAQTAKQKEEVEAYIKALKSAKDPKARAGAANALSDLALVKTSLARPAEVTLIASLKDDSGEVRAAVVRALSLLEPYKKDRIPGL